MKKMPSVNVDINNNIISDNNGKYLNMSIKEFLEFLKNELSYSLFNEKTTSKLNYYIYNYNEYNGFGMNCSLNYEEGKVIINNIPTPQDIRAIKLKKINKKINSYKYEYRYKYRI